jgi:hypothetical protein
MWYRTKYCCIFHSINVPIHPSHWKFLRFGFKGKVFQFKGVPILPQEYLHRYCSQLWVIFIWWGSIYPISGRLSVSGKIHSSLTKECQSGTVHPETGFLINHSESFLTPTQDLILLFQEWGRPNLDLFASRANSQCLMEARSSGISHGRSFARLVCAVHVCLSICPNPAKSNSENTAGLSRFYSPILAQQFMVSNSSLPIHRWPNLPPVVQQAPDSGQRETASSEPRSLVPGCLEDKCRHLQARGLSSEAARTI